jgi:hypothetical protein
MNEALRFLIAACALIAPAGLYAAGCGATKPDALDAVAVAPDTYKVLLENETIRILDVNLPAGAKEPAHSHLWPALIIEDAPRPGAPAEVRNFKSRWQAAQVRDAGDHTGKGPAHSLRIELKKGDCAAVKEPGAAADRRSGNSRSYDQGAV